MPSLTTILLCTFLLCCKESSEKNNATEVESEDVEIIDEEILENGENLIIDVPSFENPAIQDYVDTYEEYLKEYTKAVDSQDIEALSDLGPKGQELSIKAREISGNMSVEDAQKFTHYMTEKAEVIRELTLKMSN